MNRIKIKSTTIPISFKFERTTAKWCQLEHIQHIALVLSLKTCNFLFQESNCQRY